MVIKAINFHIFPPTSPPLYKPLFHFIFKSQIILSENLFSSLSCFPSGPKMAKTRGAHSFRPQVRQDLTPPAAGPSAAGPTAAGPASGPSASSPTAVGAGITGPSAAAAGTGPSVPAVRPIIAAASLAPAAGDAEGSSSVAPAQRRYHGLGPLYPLLHIPG